MAKNGLIALRPLRGRGAGLVRLSAGEAVFALRGISRGRAHLVLEGGRILSAPLSRTPGGAQARIRFGGSVMGAGVTAGPEVLLVGLSGPGSLAELAKRLHGAAQEQERAAREEKSPPSRFEPAGKTELSGRESPEGEKEPDSAQAPPKTEETETGPSAVRQPDREEFSRALREAVAQRPEAEDVLRMMPHPVPPEEEQEETRAEDSLETALSEEEGLPEDGTEEEALEKEPSGEPSGQEDAQQEAPEEQIRIWEGLPREKRKETALTEEATLLYIPPQQEEEDLSEEGALSDRPPDAQEKVTEDAEQTESPAEKLWEEIPAEKEPETPKKDEDAKQQTPVLPPETEDPEKMPESEEETAEVCTLPEEEKKESAPPETPAPEKAQQNKTSGPESGKTPEPSEETEEGEWPKPPQEEPAEEVCPCEVERMERAGALAAMVAPAVADAEAEAMLPHRPRGERKLFFPQNDWERQCLDVLMERQPCWKPAKGKLMGVFVNAFPREYPKANWQIFSQAGGGHVLRCQWEGKVYYALPAQQAAHPPAGLPAGSTGCVARNQRKYWVFRREENGR